MILQGFGRVCFCVCWWAETDKLEREKEIAAKQWQHQLQKNITNWEKKRKEKKMTPILNVLIDILEGYVK